MFRIGGGSHSEKPVLISWHLPLHRFWEMQSIPKMTSTNKVSWLKEQRGTQLVPPCTSGNKRQDEGSLLLKVKNQETRLKALRY